jgi:pilus assembly protein Flp/PilA
MSFARFVLEDDAVTAIEYGLIAALVAVAILVALTNLGQSMESNYRDVASTLDSAI